MEIKPWPGVGVDIVAISEVERFVERHRDSLRRLYTEREIAYCQGKRNSVARFAARFAAIEAVLKALGNGNLDLKDIEILNDFWGKPQVYIHNQAELGEVLSISVSLSHSKDYAVAYALVMPR
jgi:holo-[acyl-carrier protein] synthase